jgi:hypothetical protein
MRNIIDDLRDHFPPEAEMRSVFGVSSEQDEKKNKARDGTGLRRFLRSYRWVFSTELGRACLDLEEQRMKREFEAVEMQTQTCEPTDEKLVADNGHTTYGVADNEDIESSKLEQHVQDADLDGDRENDSDLGKQIPYDWPTSVEIFFLDADGEPNPDAVDAEELYGGNAFVADEVSSLHNLDASTASTGETEESPLTEFSDDFSTSAELQAAVDGAEDWEMDEGESDRAEETCDYIHCECPPQIHQF